MVRRKRLCMINTEIEEEQHHDEVAHQSDMHSPSEASEAMGTNSSEEYLSTDEGHISQNHREVEGPQKKVRGPTRKDDLWKMDKKKKIVVTFNRYGKPIGDEGNELTQFLGSIVRIAGNVDLSCSDWRKVPMNKKEDMYSIVKEKFVFLPAETIGIKKWIMSNMGKKLNTWRNLVKSRNYDPTLSIDETIARQTDKRLNPDQFKDLVKRWMKPEYQVVCEQKRTSRSKMEEPHITGTKSFARLAHEEEMKSNGVQLTRGDIYQKSRTRGDGSIVNEKAAQVVASLQAISTDNDNTQTGNTEGLEDDWTNDDFSKVKGPEKRGYVRLIGKMPSVKNNGTTSSTSSQNVEQKLARTEDALKALVHLFKEHLPNANLSGVLSSMNLEIPGNLSMGRNTTPNGNHASSSRGPNNGMSSTDL